MKGHRTRQTKEGVAAAAAENAKPPRQRQRRESLRRPSEVEQRLFDIAQAVHVEKHFGKFERCWEADCKETLRILNVTGFLHLFDEPKAAPPAQGDQPTP